MHFSVERLFETETDTEMMWENFTKTETIMITKKYVETVIEWFLHRMKQEAQLMPTNPRDAFRGQSMSTNSSIPYVKYSFLLCNSNFVFTIFDFKKCRDLEIRVSGHSRLSKIIPFNPAPMTSY